MGERIMSILTVDSLRIAVEQPFERMVEFGYVKADKVYTDVISRMDKDVLEARVSLSFELNREDLYSQDKINEKLSAVLKSSIVDSVCHKRQVEDLTTEIASLQNQIKELTNAVSELQQFKTHYDLAYAMTHGRGK
jgi:polyhydroxyalkanoate synthesis regulator phasin